MLYPVAKWLPGAPCNMFHNARRILCCGGCAAYLDTGMSLQWDLTFHDHHLESRFMERFNSSLLLADKTHCVILMLVMLIGIGCNLTADGRHEMLSWILASGARSESNVFARP